MFTDFKRIFKFAVSDLSRNKGISVAAIFILVVMIMVVSGLFFLQGVAGYLTSQLQNKIDITAYFKEGTQEQDILAAKYKIQNLSADIKSVEYVSEDQALALFNEKHGNNPILAKALEEVGENPFLPSLNITTGGDPAKYAEVYSLLKTSEFNSIIEDVDFSQKKDTIDKVYSIISNVNLFGIIFSIVLVIVAVLVVFNTIKLGIENSREEISTMRVVGASNWFVRGPFIIQGMIYGCVAFLICFLISGIFAFAVSAKLSIMLPGFSAIEFFLANSWFLILIQLGFGMAVGGFSALIVVKKHLEV